MFNICFVYCNYMGQNGMQIHCVWKKVNHCIHFHNSGKQCLILAKFCSNNATSNCKETAKFQ